MQTDVIRLCLRGTFWKFRLKMSQHHSVSGAKDSVNSMSVCLDLRASILRFATKDKSLAGAGENREKVELSANEGWFVCAR